MLTLMKDTKLLQEQTQIYEHIFENCTHSESVLVNVIDSLIDLESQNVCVVVTGSLARKEANRHSDCDHFIIFEETLDVSQKEQIIQDIGNRISSVKPPADDGPFGQSIIYTDLTRNIGGNDDSNQNITRRVLFILECRCLVGEAIYDKAAEDLVKRYIGDRITEEQLGMFLLNDIIRYYRTMCIDFEYKTVEQGKPWGIRNIKLVFSRKLLYFSGVLMCAELAQRTVDEKRYTLRELMKLTPIERILVLGGGYAHRVLGLYDEFLQELSCPDFRKECEKVVTADRDTHTPRFRRLKHKSQRFNWTLISMMNSIYPPSHPIHKAIIL